MGGGLNHLSLLLEFTLINQNNRNTLSLARGVWTTDVKSTIQSMVEGLGETVEWRKRRKWRKLKKKPAVARTCSLALIVSVGFTYEPTYSQGFIYWGVQGGS